jgi:hypothetical protein
MSCIVEIIAEGQTHVKPGKKLFVEDWPRHQGLNVVNEAVYR